MIPQLMEKRVFNYSDTVDGLRQILYGFFKKIVIADNCAYYVNLIFHDYIAFSGSTLVIGAILFSLQIYFDFSGYSDIAIGTGRLFGIKINKNFNYPYFSKNIAEFWRNWHISLYRWLQDYIFKPLQFSFRKHKSAGTAVALIITFLICGLWHGANWTYIVWGLLNGLYLIPFIFIKRKSAQKQESFYKTIIKTIFTFSLVTFTWIIFRSESLYMAYSYIRNIFSPSLFKFPEILPKNSILVVIIVTIFFELFQKNKPFPLDFSKSNINKPVRWSIYYALIILIFFLNSSHQDFLYFKF